MSYINTRCTDVETWAEAKFLARLDYELHLGHEVVVSDVTTYINDDSCDHVGTFRVRLDETDPCDLGNATDEYLDPYWEVTMLDQVEGTSPWAHGPSYRVLEWPNVRVPS